MRCRGGLFVRVVRSSTTLVTLLALPLLIWVVIWAVRGWTPEGDEASIAIKVHDVFSAHPPLLATRSTSAATVPGVWAHHPGPIEVYLLAVPYRITAGRPIGLLLGCFALAASFIALAVHHAYAVAGARAVSAVAITIAVLEVVLGPVLVLPWNPWPPVLGMVALVVLTWRLLLEGIRVLPVFAAVASVVAQANLALLPILAPLLAALAFVGLARWREVRGVWWPLPGWRPAQRPPVWRRAGPVTLAVTVICWLPVIVGAFIRDPSNVQEMWLLATGAHGGLGTVAAIVVVPAVAVIARTLRHRDRRRPWRTARRLTVLLLLGMVLAGAHGDRGRLIYLFMAAAVPVFGATAVCSPWLPKTRNLARAAVAGLVGAVAVTVLLAPGVSPSPVTRALVTTNVQSRAALTQAVIAVDQYAGKRRPVVIRAEDVLAAINVEPALALRLIQRGQPTFYDRPSPAPFLDTPWPYREDDSRRLTSAAPKDAVTVTLHDHAAPTITLPAAKGAAPK